LEGIAAEVEQVSEQVGYHGRRWGPVSGFADRAIHGAVLMSCRRRHYREAIHESLEKVTGGQRFNRFILDPRLNAEERLLRREQRRNVDGPREYRRGRRLFSVLALAPAPKRRVWCGRCSMAATSRNSIAPPQEHGADLRKCSER
jgi:hypothetical protein